MTTHEETSHDHKGEEGIHWSKDFVEHLRTVHFALIAVSIGLIALTLAHPTGPLDRALRNLAEIKKLIVGDRGSRHGYYVGVNYSDWVGEWAEAQVRRAIAAERNVFRTPEEQLIKAHGEVLSSNLSCDSSTGPREYLLNQVWALIEPSDGEKLDAAFVRTRIPNEGAVVETEALGLSPDMKLDEFKRLWDVLHQRMNIVVPLSRGSKVFLWNGQQLQWDAYKCADGGALPTSAVLDIGLVSDRERWSKLARLVGDEPPRYGYVSNDNTVFVSLDQFHSVPFSGQSWFLSKVPTWTAGQFFESFPELDQLSTGSSNQSLDTVKRILENKRNESGDNFEFSGVKIPTEVVMRFGTLLVLGVQIYFLAHLIELSKRLKPSDEGWEVAWIGVYSHGLARFIYLCTIGVLPALSIAALGKRGLSQIQTQNWKPALTGGPPVDFVNLSVLICGILASAYLASWIWRKTPRRKQT